MPDRNIQVFDDDDAAALITQRGLQTILGEAVSVSVATSANAAWLACAKGGVDLLIVDPAPAGGAAAGLLRAVRTYRPNLPVLVLTAYDSPGLRARMRELGVSLYLPKPLDLRDLAQVVREALRPGPAPGVVGQPLPRRAAS